MATRKTVLVVDDEPLAREAIRELLEPLGYHVAVAGDGDDGIRQADEVHPDIVVTDMLMPRQSGFRVIDAIRHRWPHVPIIMVTAQSAGQHQAYAQVLGAVDFFEKPFPPAALVASVQLHCPLPSDAP